MYYAIEIIGYGKKTRYAIKRVSENKLVIPFNGKLYRTETAARQAAKENRLAVEKVGDHYEII